MSIHLTTKATVQTFIDTMVVEAGQYFGHAQGEAGQTDQNLRPYSRDMRSAAVAATTVAVGAAIGRDSAIDKKENKKTSSTFSIANLSANLSAVLHLKSQAHIASQSLDISKQYHTAALRLNGGYHEVLTEALSNNPIAQISDKIIKLAALVEAIDGMRNSEATQYLSCGYATLFSLTTLSIGVFTPNPNVVKIGLFFLAVTGLVFLCVKLSHSGDQKKITGHYEVIGNTGEEIRHDLCYYNDEMKLLPGNGTAYRPLISAFEKGHKHAPITDDLTSITYAIPDTK